MPYYVLLSLCSLLFLTAKVSAQSLEQHHWQDRLLLLVADDAQNPVYEKQLQELRALEQDLKDRKLVVYHAFPNKTLQGLLPTQNAKLEGLYDRFQPSGSGFSLILIGLDGGVKLRHSAFTGVDEIFGLIDQMPMRQAELRRKK